jgi:hypothetical protein
MWDSVIKNISVLTAVATLVGGAIAFFVQRGDEIQQRVLQAQVNERESKRVFLDKQAELYFEVVPLVSRLANIESADLIKKEDESRFWHIFWGELGMVEDADVARAMDLFGASLNAFQGRVSNDPCANKRKAISLMLSHCVRKSLGDNWGVKLQDESINTCIPDTYEELREICPLMKEGEISKDSKSTRTTQ